MTYDQQQTGGTRELTGPPSRDPRTPGASPLSNLAGADLQAQLKALSPADGALHVVGGLLSGELTLGQLAAPPGHTDAHEAAHVVQHKKKGRSASANTGSERSGRKRGGGRDEEAEPDEPPVLDENQPTDAWKSDEDAPDPNEGKTFDKSERSRPKRFGDDESKKRGGRRERKKKDTGKAGRRGEKAAQGRQRDPAPEQPTLPELSPLPVPSTPEVEPPQGPNPVVEGETTAQLEATALANWDDEVAWHDNFAAGDIDGMAEIHSNLLIRDSMGGGAKEGALHAGVGLVTDTLMDIGTSKLPYVGGFVELGKMFMDPKGWVEGFTQGTAGNFAKAGDLFVKAHETGDYISAFEGILLLFNGATQFVTLITTICSIVAAVCFALCWIPGLQGLAAIAALMATWAGMFGAIATVMTVFVTVGNGLLMAARAGQIARAEADPSVLLDAADSLERNTMGFVQSAGTRIGDSAARKTGKQLKTAKNGKVPDPPQARAPKQKQPGKLASLGRKARRTGKYAAKGAGAAVNVLGGKIGPAVKSKKKADGSFGLKAGGPSTNPFKGIKGQVKKALRTSKAFHSTRGEGLFNRTMRMHEAGSAVFTSKRARDKLIGRDKSRKPYLFPSQDEKARTRGQKQGERLEHIDRANRKSRKGKVKDMLADFAGDGKDGGDMYGHQAMGVGTTGYLAMNALADKALETDLSAEEQEAFDAAIDDFVARIEGGQDPVEAAREVVVAHDLPAAVEPALLSALESAMAQQQLDEEREREPAVDQDKFDKANQGLGYMGFSVGWNFGGGYGDGLDWKGEGRSRSDEIVAAMTAEAAKLPPAPVEDYVAIDQTAQEIWELQTALGLADANDVAAHELAQEAQTAALELDAASRHGMALRGGVDVHEQNLAHNEAKIDSLDETLAKEGNESAEAQQKIEKIMGNPVMGLFTKIMAKMADSPGKAQKKAESEGGGSADGGGDAKDQIGATSTLVASGRGVSDKGKAGAASARSANQGAKARMTGAGASLDATNQKIASTRQQHEAACGELDQAWQANQSNRDELMAQLTAAIEANGQAKASVQQWSQVDHPAAGTEAVLGIHEGWSYVTFNVPDHWPGISWPALESDEEREEER